MCEHLLEPSHQDDSNKWSNIGLSEVIKQEELTGNHLHILSGTLK